MRRRRKRHSPEQVVRKLREAGADLTLGKSVDEVCRKLAVSRQTYFRWKREYPGVEPNKPASALALALASNESPR